MSAESTSLTVSCMCGASHHSFTVPNSRLPLPTNLCSCNISRRISGTLCTSYFPITTTPSDPKPDLRALVGYKSSNILTRLFCGTCGTHMYLEYNADGNFWGSTGTLDEPEGNLKIESHMWIEDSKDGGASEMIPEIYGTTTKRYQLDAGQSDELPRGWKITEPNIKSPADSDKLHAHCHCGGVEFYISRPNELSKQAEVPWGDLVPGQSDPSQPWWLRGDQYLGVPCACTSCRNSLGFEIAFWTCIPTANISQKNGDPFQPKPYWGTMRMYKSSESVVRTFCSRCGSNVFWDWGGEGRSTLIEVAAGLLDAESGARAEEWIHWQTGRVEFSEEATHKSLVSALEDGLKAWGVNRQ